VRQIALFALLAAAVAAACGGGKDRAPPSAHEACRSVIAALDGARDRPPPVSTFDLLPDGGVDDIELRAQAIDDERRAVERAGLSDEAVARHGARAAEAAAALRKLGGYVHTTVEQDAMDFGEELSRFINECTAPDCALVIMLIGAHTMHQGRLDLTLPLLADELSKVTLADPKLQSALDKLIVATRRAGAALADAMSTPDRVGDAIADVKRRLAGLDDARAALRGRCSK
jgi:hypothetical protein